MQPFVIERRPWMNHKRKLLYDLNPIGTGRPTTKAPPQPVYRRVDFFPKARARDPHRARMKRLVRAEESRQVKIEKKERREARSEARRYNSERRKRREEKDREQYNLAKIKGATQQLKKMIEKAKEAKAKEAKAKEAKKNAS